MSGAYKSCVSLLAPPQTMSQKISLNIDRIPFCPADASEESINLDPQVQAHPLGVRPSGNAFTVTCAHARDHIGIFATVPDEVILALLEWLDDVDLLRLGTVCRAFFAFTTSDDLWKALLLRKGRLKSRWRGSWRATYLERQSLELLSIDCKLYSDALYRPFLCSQINLLSFTSRMSPNRIPRLANLSQADFLTGWSDRPFVLTESVRQWPISSEWCQERLLDTYGEVEFRAEAVDWSLKTYVEYMNNMHDESPLYPLTGILFERWISQWVVTMMHTGHLNALERICSPYWVSKDQIVAG